MCLSMATVMDLGVGLILCPLRSEFSLIRKRLVAPMMSMPLLHLWGHLVRPVIIMTSVFIAEQA